MKICCQEQNNAKQSEGCSKFNITHVPIEGDRPSRPAPILEWTSVKKQSKGDEKGAMKNIPRLDTEEDAKIQSKVIQKQAQVHDEADHEQVIVEHPIFACV